MKVLVDEMFSTRVAELLRSEYGVDAVHVTEVGLGATDGASVADFARSDARALLTENFRHFAHERNVVLVFVRKASLPIGSAQAPAVAALVRGWLDNKPLPYEGVHWPGA